MTLKVLFERSVEQLSSTSSSPAIDVELLIQHIFNLDRLKLITAPETLLPEKKLIEFEELLQRRSEQEPIAYILGYKDFYKYRFKVNDSVLIPRPETELIVERAVKYIKDLGLESNKIRLLDLGAGSGCIGLSLLKEFPEASLASVEISSAACEVIQENSIHLGLQDRIHLINKDVLSVQIQDLKEPQFDVIVTNPPYIPFNDPEVAAGVQKYEPQRALYATEEGYSCIKQWSLMASQFLKDQGIYLMEVGYNQAETAKEFLLQLKIFNKVEIINDYQGYGRILCALKGE